MKAAYNIGFGKSEGTVVNSMNEERMIRTQEFQARINSALRGSAEDRAKSRFSEFVSDLGPDFESRLMQAASAGGTGGIEAAMDEFDRLVTREDPVRLRHALLVFLTHHPDVQKSGLRIPPLEERSPWEVAPSKRVR